MRSPTCRTLKESEELKFGSKAVKSHQELFSKQLIDFRTAWNLQKDLVGSTEFSYNPFTPLPRTQFALLLTS